MKNSVLLILMSLLLLTACSNNDEPSEVLIRIENASIFDFKEVVVNASGTQNDYDNIDAGQKSGYKAYELAYRYAFVELEIEGETYTLQPIDYVGETPLDNGKYTYQLTANSSTNQYGRLGLTLIED